MPDATSPKRFEICPNGDPYSRAWDAREWTPQGWVFRGDLSHTRGKASLKRFLRETYPGCRIRTADF